MTMRFLYFSVHFRRLGMATGLTCGNHSRSPLSSVMSMGAIEEKSVLGLRFLVIFFFCNMCNKDGVGWVLGKEWWRTHYLVNLCDED